MAVKLTALNKIFTSITYAEERIFNKTSDGKQLTDWDRIWSQISFAETGEFSNSGRFRLKPWKAPVQICEMGDASCFMLRNSQ
jgi:hypothetical protein